MRVTLTTLAMLLSLSLAAAAADQDDKLTPERRRELEKKALELNKAEPLYREAVAIRPRWQRADK